MYNQCVDEGQVCQNQPPELEVKLGLASDAMMPIHQ